MNTHVIIATTLLLAIGNIVVAGEGLAIPATEKSREEALAKLSSERKTQIVSLLNVVKQEGAKREQKGVFAFSPLDPEAVAIRMLGELRAVEAVDILLDRIDVQTIVVGSEATIFPGYGVVPAALTSIGKPASTRAVEYLASDKSKERSKQYCRVIIGVEGYELGREMLRLAAAREKDPAKRTRLESGVQLISEWEKAKP
jgi:hypothetical protein